MSDFETAAPVREESLRELLALLKGDAAALSKLVGVFLAAEGAAVARLRKAAERGNAEEMSESAHFIKGASGSFGAKRLSALCAEIESACGRSDTDAARPLVAAAEEEFVRVKSRLEVMTL